jgi:hypothetical protein
VAAFSSYVLYLFHRLRVDLEDVSDHSATPDKRAADRPHSAVG